MHAAHAEPLSRHSNVAFGSGEVKVRVAENSKLVSSGPLVTVVSGATASTVQVRCAGVASMLPTPSTPRTSYVCDPRARPGSDEGDEQVAHAPPSRRHWKVETSSAENVNCAVLSVVVAGGPEVIVVCGAVASTDHEADAGDASTLPAVSFARTLKVCAPSARPV